MRGLGGHRIIGMRAELLLRLPHPLPHVPLASYFESATASEARERAARLARIQNKYSSWMVSLFAVVVGTSSCAMLEACVSPMATDEQSQHKLLYLSGLSTVCMCCAPCVFCCAPCVSCIMCVVHHVLCIMCCASCVLCIMLRVWVGGRRRTETPSSGSGKRGPVAPNVAVPGPASLTAAAAAVD